MGPKVVPPPAKAVPAKAVSRIVRPPRPVLPKVHAHGRGGGGPGPLQPGRVTPGSWKAAGPLPVGRVVAEEDPISFEEVDKAPLAQEMEIEKEKEKEKEKEIGKATSMEMETAVEKDIIMEKATSMEMEPAVEKDIIMEKATSMEMEPAVEKDNMEKATSMEMESAVEKDMETVTSMEMETVVEKELETATESEENIDQATGLRAKSAAAQAPVSLRRFQRGVGESDAAGFFIPINYGINWQAVRESRLTRAGSGTMDTPTSNHDDPSPLESSDWRPSGYVPTRAPLSDTSPAE